LYVVVVYIFSFSIQTSIFAPVGDIPSNTKGTLSLILSGIAYVFCKF